MELSDIRDNQTNQKVDDGHSAKEHEPQHEDHGEALTDPIISKMIRNIIKIELSCKVLGN